MEYLNGSSNISKVTHLGKQAPLPPRSPFQWISPVDSEHIFTSAIGSEGIFKPIGEQVHHQRASSDSILIEEQPSWLDELLSEPETSLCKGHRRSSSDSVAYLEIAANPFRKENKFKSLIAGPSWVSYSIGHHEEDPWHPSSGTNPNSVNKQQDRAWESSLRNGITPQNSGSSNLQKQVQEGKEGPSVNNDYSQGSQASKTDSKRAKQQIAHRSRVRRLQYIAELERNVQILQGEGSEVSAELEYLDQQILILSMENIALKQRLESLSQVQQLKHLEQDMLEREIGRLQILYQQQQHQLQPQQQHQLQPQQQQQQQQKHSTHRRSKNRELDSKFAKLAI